MFTTHSATKQSAATSGITVQDIRVLWRPRRLLSATIVVASLALSGPGLALADGAGNDRQIAAPSPGHTRGPVAPGGVCPHDICPGPGTGLDQWCDANVEFYGIGFNQCFEVNPPPDSPGWEPGDPTP